MTKPGTRSPRQWWLVAMLLTGALLHGATWIGIGLGAAVLWHSISAFYFQQSYTAAWLPLGVAGFLTASAGFLIARRRQWAAIPAFLAMLLSAVMMPRMGTVSILSPYIHPMQLVHWAAVALSVTGCIWLFAISNSAARPQN